MTGEAYLAVMEELQLNHADMAAALGVSKWCSIAWRNGRRKIPPIAELAMLSLILERYVGALGMEAARRKLAALKEFG